MRAAAASARAAEMGATAAPTDVCPPASAATDVCPATATSTAAAEAAAGKHGRCSAHAGQAEQATDRQYLKAFHDIPPQNLAAVRRRIEAETVHRAV